MSNQEWRSVIGYEGLYQVNSNGDVYSFSTRKMLTPSKAEYLRVRLSKDGRVRNVLVHIIVADAFLANPKNLPIVNHINTNKHDPRLCNLERTSFRGNSRHARDNDLSPNFKINKHVATIIRNHYKTGVYSQKQLAEYWGVSRSTISDIVRGRTWV